MTDLDGRSFVKRNGGWFPADFAADEWSAQYADGDEVILTDRKARSPQHHRWFFALLRKVVENSDDWSDEDVLLDDLKLATGHFERRVNLITKQPYAAPKTISFANMGEAAFRRWKNRALYVLGRAIGVDPVTLMEEVDETQRRNAA